MNFVENLLAVTPPVTIAVAAATIFLKSYLKKKGELLASREEFEELNRKLIENTKATEEIKHTLQRKADARTQGANEIFSSLSEIESVLINWNMCIYFRKSQMPDDSKIEELGRKDLADIAQLLVKHMRIISRYDIYFCSEINQLAIDWVNKVYSLIFDMEAIYKTSINYHNDKQVTDKDKLKWIAEMFNKEAHHQLDEIRKIKKELSSMLIEDLEKNC